MVGLVYKGLVMRNWIASVTVLCSVALFGAQAALSQQFVDPTGLVVETETGEFLVEGVERVELERAHELFVDSATFIDVRNVWRYDIAHIRGAIGMELNSEFSKEALVEHVAKDQPVVFYCNHSACPRSAIAAAMALTWGYTEVYHFADGWSVWSSYGYETE